MSMTWESQGTAFTLRRRFTAPRHRVWEVWTEPAHIERWWGPEGFTARVEEMDFRVGGRWRHVMIGPDGTEYPGTGVFLEIEPGVRYVSTDDFDEGFEVPGVDELPQGMVIEIGFADLEDGGTEVTISARHRTEEDRAAHEEMGAIEGWRSMLEELERYLDSLD